MTSKPRRTARRLPLLLSFAAAAALTGPAGGQAAAPARPGSAQKDVAAPARPVVGTSQALSIVPSQEEAVRRQGRYFWSEIVQSPKASFLKPHFVDVRLEPGDSLVVRSRSGRVVEEIRGRGPRGSGSFWGLSAFGEVAYLELSYAEPYEHPPFRIDQVIVGDPGMFAPPEQGESICAPEDFDDVICYMADAAKWDNVLGSVGVMSVGGNPATALFCSGSNVSPQNYVLTNAHCLTSQADCDSAEFVFKYYRTACNIGAPANLDWQGFRCDDIVAQSPFISCDQGLNDLDFSLCSVIGDPASTFGHVTPDPTPITDGEGIYIVQHPAGRPHEIAHGSGANVDADGTVLRYYDTLDTEGGSSGSPIFREADDLLVGLHHCGGCSSPGVGNRGMLMSDIYPHIEPFLCTPSLDVSATGFEGLAEVSGNGDAKLDQGEVWEFVPTVRNNSCSDLAMGVTADLQVNPASEPVLLVQGSASFGDVAATETASAMSPVSFRVGTGADCGGTVILDLVNITATNGGPFDDEPALLSELIGEEVLEIPFQDAFAGGLGSWTIVDGGLGAGPAQTWTTGNPGGRSLSLTAPFAIVDSDAHGSTNAMDEQLISPVIDATDYAIVRLGFAHDFNWYELGQDEQADVDVRSSATGGVWTNVANYSGGDAGGSVVLDISTWAAGQADVEIRFHYYDALFEWWWAIDDVFIEGIEGFECDPVSVNGYHHAGRQPGP